MPPVARDDDEQIVFNVPLLAAQQDDLPLTEGEEVSEVDKILLDTTPGAENIVQVENDESSTAVLITKLQLDRQGNEEATEEEIALANSLGIFALDLSDERTSSEAAATTPTVFKGIEELTDEELRKSVVFTLPRGSVGISNAMKEMNLGRPLSKALTKGVQRGSDSAGLNLSSKAPPVPPKKAPPQAKAASSTDSDVFMRPTDVPGKASAPTPKEPVQPPPKKMPVQRGSSPAVKTAAKTAAPPASPPEREGTWIKGTDLPPLSTGTRPITDEKKRRLGGKCTFILRGFTNKPEFGDRTPNIRLRAGDLSADWKSFCLPSAKFGGDSESRTLCKCSNSPLTGRLAMKFLQRSHRSTRSKFFVFDACRDIQARCCRITLTFSQHMLPFILSWIGTPV